MDVFEIRRNNLKLLTVKRGSKTQLAHDTNTAAAWISQILAGAHMGDDFARRIEETRQLPRGWMDVLQSIDMGQPVMVLAPEDGIPEGFVAIKEYDVRFSCGATANAELGFDEIEGGTPAIYKKQWLKEIQARPEALKRFKATGTSMMPVIRHDWRIAVDTDKTELPRWTTQEADYLFEQFDLSIYCIIDDDTRKTKYAYIDSDTNELVLRSHNSQFKTERYSMEYAHDYIRVVGKVVEISGVPT
ncbi:S24 family peptidase [Hydromonas duriensis]|uniref:Phage repressor protein C with HTH and peptisase S24 domain n=1 Tax=Hydromonas duriensis TaxID=1527608 RepID=A0A4R6Y2A1_9BURK|nr:S24 family peptidase [Hydromonas duriensis]TDR30660.1 hypothetical protein DFR44_1187 [Hydromonas duriensis]